MAAKVEVPFAQLEAAFEDPALLGSVAEVLKSGTYILGPRVQNFETAFADWIGGKHSVGVANGTEALALSLRACGIGPGDEVISVSSTAVATVAAIEMIGAQPVLIDIDPSTRCLDPKLIEPAISPHTRAIIPVHLYGQPAPMLEILDISNKHGLKVIEDCAQACGASIRERKVGTFGHAAAFSFYPTKNLGAAGDGGAVVTNSPEVAEHVRSLRQYGWNSERESIVCGINSRLDEMQAAILTFRLKKLKHENAKRREIANRYSNSLSSALKGPLRQADVTHALHLFVVESDNREEFRSHLKHNSIDSAVHYPLPIHLQAAYRGRIRSAGPLPHAERLSKTAVSLPLHPALSERQVEHVCATLSAWPP